MTLRKYYCSPKCFVVYDTFQHFYPLRTKTIYCWRRSAENTEKLFTLAMHHGYTTWNVKKFTDSSHKPLLSLGGKGEQLRDTPWKNKACALYRRLSIVSRRVCISVSIQGRFYLLKKWHKTMWWESPSASCCAERQEDWYCNYTCIGNIMKTG